MNRKSLAILVGGLLVAGVAGLAAFRITPGIGCGSLGERDRSRLVAFVQAKYKLPSAVEIAVADAGTVTGSCYHKLVFVAEHGQRHFRVELFASPDYKFLARDLVDARVEPKQLHEEQLKLEASLVQGNLPFLGAERAPATLVVFSDFQCPFCARMAAMLKSVMVSEGEHARLVYHYFPLAMHNWARPAAEAAACAQQQGNQAFWNVHDFLFTNQRDLTKDNLNAKLIAHMKTVAGFDSAKFQACIVEHRTSGQVEQDAAFGNEAGIHATPTVFLNGQQISVVGPEQLHTLIRQLSADPKASVPSPVAEGDRLPGRKPAADPACERPSQ